MSTESGSEAGKRAKIWQISKSIGFLANDYESGKGLSIADRKEWNELEKELAKLEGRPEPPMIEALSILINKDEKIEARIAEIKDALLRCCRILNLEKNQPSAEFTSSKLEEVRAEAKKLEDEFQKLRGEIDIGEELDEIDEMADRE